MTESLEKRPLPRDFPAVDTPRNRLNIRKALAGLYLLQGRGSTTRCLADAGYSRATIRNLTLKGLGAKECIEEAAKLDESAVPAKMLEAGRRRAMLCIESVDPTNVRLADAMRMLDTVEKYYGGHEIQPGNTLLSMADRLSQLVSLLVVAQQRGLPVPTLPADFIEAKVIESAGSDTSAIDNEAQAPNDKGFATGKVHYVNSGGGPLRRFSRESIEPPRDIHPNF